MASKPIGSVFLGDLLRNPFSSPPSSPPPHGEQDTTMDSIDQLAADVDDVIPGTEHAPEPASASDPASEPTSEPVSEPESESQVGSDLESEVSSAAEADVDADVLPPPATATPRERIPLPPPANVDPETSLELRILWLETLLFGPRNTVDTKDGGARKPDPSVRPGHTITRDVEDIQKRLDAIVAGHDGLRQFIAQYEQHADLLTPAFALSGTLPEASPTYDNMSAAEMEALLAEMEPDIRAADRDMREIEELEKKGVTSAGHLGDYEALQPRLQALLEAHEEDARTAAELENRVATLVQRYGSHVDALSDLFVDWNDTVTVAELQLNKRQREHKERQRLGY